MDTKKREYFLDKLRVAATCAVVLLHTVTGAMDATDMSIYPREKTFFLVILDLVCWSVPVFLLISGYLFLNLRREISFQLMVKKYCRRVLLALFLFGVPYACMEQVAVEKTLRPGIIARGVLAVLQGKSWSHMWYLYLILFLYLLTPALRWLLKRLPKAGVYLILAILLAGSSILPFVKKLMETEWIPVLPDVCIYFFYYICGYVFACGRQSQEGEREVRPKVDDVRLSRLLGMAAFLLATVMTCSRLAGYSIQMAYNYPGTVALALLLFAWGLCGQRQGNRKNRNTEFLETASALSFGVYLVHPVFLNVYYKFLHMTPFSFAVWASVPLLFLAILLPAALVSWLLRKVPPLKKYVL